MSRGPKPAKSKEAKPPGARNSPKDDGRVLESRLAEALRDKAEGQEQQTATAEILCVISQSLTDVQPVFDMIAANAVRLCVSRDAQVFLREKDLLRQISHHGSMPFTQTLPLILGTANGRAVLEGRTVHVADMQVESGEFPEGSKIARRLGLRTILSVPLMRDGAAIGAIAVRRTESRLFTDRQVALLQTFADQAVIAIENVRLFKELEARNRDLTTALAQQTATSEILRVISSSPTDVQPVFEAIADSAIRLFGAWSVLVFRYDGEYLSLAAARGGLPGSQELLIEQYPTRRPSAELPPGQVILTRAVHHCVDTETDSTYPAIREYARMRGYRSFIQVPMLRGNDVLGVVSVTRTRPGAFAVAEVALLRTFADQAVIAIENVRLFTELQEKNRALTTALDQQTATSEILRVISSSPTDLQPVMDAVAENAARICGATDATIRLIEGDIMRVASRFGAIAPVAPEVIPIDCDSHTGRAIVERRTIHIEDIRRLPETEFPRIIRENQRTVLATPLMRKGEPIGAILIRRVEVDPFTDKQIELLKTFADQAVIAIENVRLFKELQTSNRDLTTALDKQTATSDILRVISQSQTDVQPVFEAILSSAIRLMSAQAGALTRVTGDQLELAAFKSTDARGAATLREAFPQSLQSEGAHTKAIRDRAPVNIADAQTDPELRAIARSIAQAVGYHSMVAVPMLYQDGAIGTISTTRREAGGFTADEISLLQTFADQAVIAIENVRLFKELQENNQALTAAHAQVTESLEQQTATSEVLKVISRSTFALQPVLDTLVENAVRLCGADRGFIFRLEGDVYRLAVAFGATPEFVEFVRNNPIRPGRDTLVGRTAFERRVVHLPDVFQDPEYGWKEAQERGRFRTLLGVPMLREGSPIGVIVIWREEVQPFSDKQIELVTTFADQAVIAIENVRLFTELEVANRELAEASQHKSEFLANMSHELRTPLNAIIGFSEVLSERMFGELNEKQEEYLKDIYSSGTHLLSLINDILDLSKIEAGRMELELSDFHLPTTLDSALTLVRERAGRRGIALQINVDERLGEIQADERKVRQVVLNLLSNAIKFTPESGRIEVAAMSRDGSVEISVSDTGVGIAPEDQEAVFEEFRQVGTAEKKVEGTGLGLTLCRKFVELHGGRIWVKSEVGVGSTFTFSLPLRKGNEAG